MDMFCIVLVAATVGAMPPRPQEQALVSTQISPGKPLDPRPATTAAGPGPDVPELEPEPRSPWRQRLDRHGLSLGAEYVAEITGVLRGGVHQRGSFRNLLTVDASLDLGPPFGVEGGTVFVHYLSAGRDRGGSKDAGDIQVASNLETDRNLDVIYELWYEQRLLDDRLRVKLGKVDANSEFAQLDAAAHFAHSSAGFSPTTFVLPTYPDPATSVNVFGTVFDSRGTSLVLGYGLYDGALQDGVRTGSRGPASFLSDERSDDLMHLVQSEFAWTRPAGRGGLMRDGRVSVGAWRHHGAFPRFDGSTQEAASGFFLTGEVRVFDPDRTEESTRGLYAFAQYGRADGEVSEIAQHVGLGLVWRGPTQGRAHDTLGLYASLADLSDQPGAEFDGDESAVEVSYRWHLAPAAFVQPLVQYIHNPSGDAAIEDAIIGGLRMGVTF
jgi:porin